MPSIINFHFLVKSTKGVTTNKFLIKDLTGTSGRLDIIFRCIQATFSFGYKNIIFHTVLCGPPNPPKSLDFIGNQLKDLPLDEIRMARLFQGILKGSQFEGISITDKSFLQLASELTQIGPIVLLQEDSLPYSDYLNELNKVKENIESLTFILSDHIDLEPSEKDLLRNKLGATLISLGSESYLASHCIIFLLMKLKGYVF